MQLLDPPLHAAIRAAGCQDYLFCFRWIMVSLKREFALSQVRPPRPSPSVHALLPQPVTPLCAVSGRALQPPSAIVRTALGMHDPRQWGGQLLLKGQRRHARRPACRPSYSARHSCFTELFY